jgi:hypothetical protein
LESDEKLDTGQAMQASEEIEMPGPERLVMWRSQCATLPVACVRKVLLPVVE